MQRVYSHQNPLMAYNIANALQNEDIDCQVRNEMIISVMGEGAGFDAWPEVWVNDGDVERALEVINKALKSKPNKAHWRCKNCGEMNEANFEVCWQCSSVGTP